MFEGCDGRVGDARSLQSSTCVLPNFVCCLSCLLDIQLCRSLIDDRGKASPKEVLWK